MSEIIPVESIEQKILMIRGQKVMLDKDLAVLYDVKPIRLREQVKRNIKRFPEDFMFQLNKKEIDLMVSQNAIPSRKHLYKYGSLVKPERLRQIMLEDTLYSPTSSQLNDPTESLPIFADQSLDEIFDYLCEQFKVDNSHASSEQLEKIRKDGRRFGKEVLMIKMQNLFCGMMENRYGILSFSQREDSMPLWAHYADNHTGYCLEFLNEQEFATGYKVLYQEKLPFKIQSNINSNQVDFLYTKQPDWASEKEVRILVKPPGAKPFSPHLLVSVRLGKDVKPENMEKVLDWALKRMVPIKVLKANFNSSTQKIEYLTME